MIFLPENKAILEAYVARLKSIDVQTDEEFYAALEAHKQTMLAELKALRDERPELLLSTFSENITEAEARNAVRKIKENAQTHYCLDLLPSTDFFVDEVQGESILTPSFIQNPSTQINVNVPKDTEESKNSKDIEVSFLIGMLLYLPIKKLRFTFVDLRISYKADFFYRNIDDSIYHSKPITDEYALKNMLHSMNERVLNCMKQYGNITEYNKKNKTIDEPYEVIVFFDGYNRLDGDCKRELDALLQNGNKAGIYVINFTNDDDKVYHSKNENAEMSFHDSIVSITPIARNQTLLKACIEYINEEAAKEEETKVLTLDTKSMVAAQYESIRDSLQIPVGKKGQEVINFRMDTVSHVHAFILGQSGSGKSVFLHNVISGAMLKYSPEDLELYLLDFKLGGVEFNRYKGEKHVHAMLVDNSDTQITLEILRELRDRMAERGKELRKAGINNIREYNYQHPDNKMKHILFVADECHEMFRTDENNRAVSNEISEIIVKIAKEGRNQGVHLLLATQTIANTDISNEILNNISDHYLLKCALADSEKMVTKSSDITSKLTTGNVYYHHVDDSYVFQAFYADKHQAAEIMQSVNEKTETFATNETFYFNGASIFRFDHSAIQEYSRKCRKMPVAFVGKSIDIKQNDLAISLSEDFSENILLLGLNDECQSTRTTMNLLVSLLATCKYREANVDFKVIDCLSDDDKYAEQLDDLADAGLVDVIPAKRRGQLFRQLAEDIQSGHAKETILFILGQDRFRELKLDLDLGNDTAAAANDKAELTSIISFGTDMSALKTTSVDTFSKALDVILDKGPEVGVHTVIQLEKPSNYLFSDYISHKELFQKFKHLILLKSDSNAATQLHLRNDIRLENLSKDEERLRAYYYAEESDTYTLFTPYMPLEGNEFKQFINKL